MLTLLRRFFERIKGRSIFDIEWLRAQAEPEIKESGVAAAVALSGIEQCLWDIRGKAFGVPVYELLGGICTTASAITPTSTGPPMDRTPAGFAAMAERAIAAGFDAIKLAPFDEMPKGLTDAAKIEEFTQARAGLRRRRPPRDRPQARPAHRRAQPFRSAARPGTGAPLRAAEPVLAGGGDAAQAAGMAGDHQSRGQDAHRRRRIHLWRARILSLHRRRRGGYHHARREVCAAACWS